MLEIVNKGRVLTYADVYFTDNSTNVIDKKCDICTYHNLYDLHNEANSHFMEYTLLSDLTLSEEELWQCIHKNTRYEIRRAERSPFVFEVYNSHEIESGYRFNFESFRKMYENMFEEKGLPRILDRNEFFSIINSGGGTVTAVLLESTPIVYHFYINDDTHTKLTISCSEIWSNEEKNDRNLIGYANKWLHWKDLLYFREKGCVSYDWGGVTWNEDNPGNLDGINKFKASFGGNPVSYYCETVIVSTKANLVMKLSNLKNKLLK